MTDTTNTAGLALLRQTFPDNQISYLPKGGAKLAYVGHAALTDRLLDADPAWTWEPLSLDQRGLPALDEHGGLWIKLTVCGITRLGYGDAGQKKGGDAMKERIGDALRNAAMRFGAALDLWHKGELHAHQNEDDAPPQDRQPAKQAQGFKQQPQRGEPRQDQATQSAQVIKMVKAGNVQEAADWLGTLTDDVYQTLWDKLPLDVQDAISEVYAKAQGVAA